MVRSNSRPMSTLRAGAARISSSRLSWRATTGWVSTSSASDSARSLAARWWSSLSSVSSTSVRGSADSWATPAPPEELLDYGDGNGDVQDHEPGAGDRGHGEAGGAVRLGQDVEQVVPGPLLDRGQGYVDLRAHEGGQVGGEQPAEVLGQQGEHLFVFFLQRAGRPHPEPPQRLGPAVAAQRHHRPLCFLGAHLPSHRSLWARPEDTVRDGLMKARA